MKEFDFTPDEMKTACDRIINAFGLARRAGKCAVGADICIELIRKKKAKLVLISDGVSDNTVKKLVNSCAFHNVELLHIPLDKYKLGEKLGKKSGITCAAVTDDSFLNICRKVYLEVHKQSMEVQQ